MGKRNGKCDSTNMEMLTREGEEEEARSEDSWWV